MTITPSSLFSSSLALPCTYECHKNTSRGLHFHHAPKVPPSDCQHPVPKGGGEVTFLTSCVGLGLQFKFQLWLMSYCPLNPHRCESYTVPRQCITECFYPFQFNFYLSPGNYNIIISQTWPLLIMYNL